VEAPAARSVRAAGVQPGDLAEVDFFEALVELSGKREKLWMFVMRLMHSGRDFACLYTRQDQTSFLDGHVRAFEHFGCVPQRIAYAMPGSLEHAASARWSSAGA
jgi:transposase